MLAVDDLHWCDRSSLRFLGYLTRRLEGLPILVVAGLRPSEPGADEALLAELTGDPAAQKLAPQPLSLGASADLVHELLGEDVEPAFAGACHASTHGNPLLLNELLKTLEAEHVRPDAAHVDVVIELGPRAVSRAVLLRLARLSRDAVGVARWLAVAGDGADTALARRARRSGQRTRGRGGQGAGTRGDRAPRATARVRSSAGAGCRLPRPGAR